MTEKAILELARMVSDAADRVDRVNKRLVYCIIGLAFCFCAAITVMTGFYFLGDYQYPEVTQEAVQTGTGQTVQQNIK
jgi:hypothetical protein